MIIKLHNFLISENIAFLLTSAPFSIRSLATSTLSSVAATISGEVYLSDAVDGGGISTFAPTECITTIMF